jgi:hypothetical protein
LEQGCTPRQGQALCTSAKTSAFTEVIRRKLSVQIFNCALNGCSKVVRIRGRKLGVSQEEFADICGLDRTYVDGIERGERNLGLVNLEKLAKALKLSFSELFREV